MKNNIGYKIYTKATIDKIEAKVKQLGIYSNYNALTFLNQRLLLTIIIFMAILLMSKYGYILAPVLSVVFYIVSEKIVFDYQIKKRGVRLEKEALFFFEVLILTLEGGRNLKHALDLTVENIDSELSEEFKRALAEVNLGKSLNESLKDLKKRIPSDTINNAVLNIIESNTFGSSIIDSLYNQIDYLRGKQMLDIKAQITKLPVKISIISVIFFVPLMMLLILSPVVIEFILK